MKCKIKKINKNNSCNLEDLNGIIYKNIFVYVPFFLCPRVTVGNEVFLFSGFALLINKLNIRDPSENNIIIIDDLETKDLKLNDHAKKVNQDIQQMQTDIKKIKTVLNTSGVII